LSSQNGACCVTTQQGSRKDFPKFSGEDSQDAEDHILAFIVACGILGVSEENVFVRLFIESLIRDFVDRFNQLLKKIPAPIQPSKQLKLCTLIFALHPYVQFELKRYKVNDTEIAQEEAIKIEDDLILNGLWTSNQVVNSSSSETIGKLIIQKPMSQPIDFQYMQPPTIECSNRSLFLIKNTFVEER